MVDQFAFTKLALEWAKYQTDVASISPFDHASIENGLPYNSQSQFHTAASFNKAITQYSEVVPL